MRRTAEYAAMTKNAARRNSWSFAEAGLMVGEERRIVLYDLGLFRHGLANVLGEHVHALVRDAVVVPVFALDPLPDHLVEVLGGELPRVEVLGGQGEAPGKAEGRDRDVVGRDHGKDRVQGLVNRREVETGRA